MCPERSSPVPRTQPFTPRDQTHLTDALPNSEHASFVNGREWQQSDRSQQMEPNPDPIQDTLHDRGSRTGTGVPCIRGHGVKISGKKTSVDWHVCKDLVRGVDGTRIEVDQTL